MKYYVVDAFTSEIFKGNPAGVCVLKQDIDSSLMQKIAYEHNLSETAFVYQKGDIWKLRWFTPTFEIDLCGHATLATAFVISNFIKSGLKKMEFETMSGTLLVEKQEDLYQMSFPIRDMEQMEMTSEIETALGITPTELYSARDLFVIIDSETEVRNFEPDYHKLKKLSKWMGIVITSAGEEVDFVSRYFCPELECEDPVTGSSHSNLIPFWSRRLKKDSMVARQLSLRGGELYCEMAVHTVKIAGKAALYLQGEIEILE